MAASQTDAESSTAGGTSGAPLMRPPEDDPVRTPKLDVGGVGAIDEEATRRLRAASRLEVEFMERRVRMLKRNEWVQPELLSRELDALAVARAQLTPEQHLAIEQAQLAGVALKRDQISAWTDAYTSAAIDAVFDNGDSAETIANAARRQFSPESADWVAANVTVDDVRKHIELKVDDVAARTPLTLDRIARIGEQVVDGLALSMRPGTRDENIARVRVWDAFWKMKSPDEKAYIVEKLGRLLAEERASVSDVAQRDLLRVAHETALDKFKGTASQLGDGAAPGLVTDAFVVQQWTELLKSDTTGDGDDDTYAEKMLANAIVESAKKKARNFVALDEAILRGINEAAPPPSLDWADLLARRAPPDTRARLALFGRPITDLTLESAEAMVVDVASAQLDAARKRLERLDHEVYVPSTHVLGALGSASARLRAHWKKPPSMEPPARMVFAWYTTSNKETTGDSGHIAEYAQETGIKPNAIERIVHIDAQEFDADKTYESVFVVDDDQRHEGAYRCVVTVVVGDNNVILGEGASERALVYVRRHCVRCKRPFTVAESKLDFACTWHYDVRRLERDEDVRTNVQHSLQEAQARLEREARETMIAMRRVAEMQRGAKVANLLSVAPGQTRVAASDWHAVGDERSLPPAAVFARNKMLAPGAYVEAALTEYRTKLDGINAQLAAIVAYKQFDDTRPVPPGEVGAFVGRHSTDNEEPDRAAQSIQSEQKPSRRVAWNIDFASAWASIVEAEDDDKRRALADWYDKMLLRVEQPPFEQTPPLVAPVAVHGVAPPEDAGDQGGDTTDEETVDGGDDEEPDTAPESDVPVVGADTADDVSDASAGGADPGVADENIAETHRAAPRNPFRASARGLARPSRFR
jgi:hypothetical protein